MKTDITIICTTYNHGKYVRNALEGFVSQKTSYTFKAIIHDDASLDNTRLIIKEYQKKYPDIIVPIFQRENQYSKGIDFFEKYIFPLIDSEYIAICEGDDYWCDSNKLNSQVTFLKNNPQYSACVHDTEIIKEDGSTTNNKINGCLKEKDYLADKIIRGGSGVFFHLNSIVCKADLYKQKPKDFSIDGIGDYPLAIWLALKGPIHYFPKIMSVYRTNSYGSWSERIKNNRDLRARYYLCEVEGLSRMDQLSLCDYHNSFVYAANRARAKHYLYQKKLIPLLLKPKLIVSAIIVMLSLLRRKIRVIKCKFKR